MAYKVGSVPTLANDIVNLTTLKALMNCRAYEMTDNGQPMSYVDYSANDSVTITMSSTHVYTFVPR